MISLETACERILGPRLATSITNDKGLHWTVVAAVAAARTTDDAAAIARLRSYIAENRNL